MLHASGQRPGGGPHHRHDYGVSPQAATGLLSPSDRVSPRLLSPSDRIQQLIRASASARGAAKTTGLREEPTRSTRIRRQARDAATAPGRCCAARTAFAL